MNIRAWRPDAPTIAFSVAFTLLAALLVCTASGVFGKAARATFRADLGVL